MDEQLDIAATEYLSHPRGIEIKDDKLHLSSLFEWYAGDFGDDLTGVLATLGKHTDAETTTALSGFSGKPVYAYDWGLNGYCSVDNECGE